MSKGGAGPVKRILRLSTKALYEIMVDLHHCETGANYVGDHLSEGRFLAAKKKVCEAVCMIEEDGKQYVEAYELVDLVRNRMFSDVAAMYLKESFDEAKVLAREGNG